MSSPLENLLRSGLKKEPANDREIENLIQSAERRLKDSTNASLSLESRFDLAYNAAHALALAALRHHGYRSENFRRFPIRSAFDRSSGASSIPHIGSGTRWSTKDLPTLTNKPRTPSSVSQARFAAV